MSDVAHFVIRVTGGSADGAGWAWPLVVLVLLALIAGSLLGGRR